MVLNNQKKFLSPEDIDVLAEIVERYGLGPTEFFGNPEVERMLSEAKTPEERIKIIKNLPFIKIMDKLEEILSGKSSLEDLSSFLKENLNLPLLTAEKIAKEIKERIFLTVSKEKGGISEKPTTPLRKDIYREPIE
jgi:hypothetical protein